MRLQYRQRLCVEQLEDRLTPVAFSMIGSGATLTLIQTGGAAGALTITDDGAGTITIDDAGAPPPLTLTTSGFANISINLLATDAGPFTYDLTGPRGGDVTLNINNALARTVNVDDGAGIVGNLFVRGGAGALTVVELNNPLIVGGNASFQSGLALDTLSFGVAGTVIGGSLSINRMNFVTTSANDVIGGSLYFNDSGESPVINTLTLTDTTVGGIFTYVGGNRGDIITLAGTTPTIAGLVSVNFGTQLAADTSLFTQAAGATSIIGGSVYITGGSLGTETVVLAGTVAGTSIFLNLGSALGAGPNTAIITCLFAGSSFFYLGGAGIDSITYALLAGSNNARFTALLGADNDSVTFGNPLTNPSYAYIDFGAGADTVLGLINFPFYFVNLP
jgi:hypothetical protein